MQEMSVDSWFQPNPVFHDHTHRPVLRFELFRFLQAIASGENCRPEQAPVQKTIMHVSVLMCSEAFRISVLFVAQGPVDSHALYDTPHS
jgi:hypothetical protein